MELLEINWDSETEAVILVKIDGEIFQGIIIKQEEDEWRNMKLW